MTQDLSAIPGIGPQKKRLLGTMGLHGYGDLLEYFPKQFKAYGDILSVKDLKPQQKALVRLTVVNRRLHRPSGKKSFITLRCEDETGPMQIVFFNMPFLFRRFSEGGCFLFYGKVSTEGAALRMVNPEIVKEEDIGSILPIYRTVPGLSQQDLRKSVVFALDNAGREKEWIPGEIMKRHGFPGRLEALRVLHFPKDRDLYKIARKRLVYEEFLKLQLALIRLKLEGSDAFGAPAMNPVEERMSPIVKALPFKPTASQAKVLSEFVGLVSGKGRQRLLLQGDVGTGKTLVAFLAAVHAHLNGYQTAFMAPTELLAEQHFDTFKTLFPGSDMRCLLLTANTRDKAREKTLVNKGVYDLVIGTHALLQKDIRFNRLGLIITDEQHRFGVAQRTRLSEKGTSPHVLVMSATPIPRTLTQIIYGDMSILRLSEKPRARTAPPSTRFVGNPEERALMFTHMKREIQSGRQAFFVCPRIHPEDGAIASVEDAHAFLSECFGDTCAIGMLHGRMKTHEKEQAMKSFRDGDFDVLVATSIVEVGIDVPNATIMVIDSFECFGLAQLHQLRGRVGRGGHPATCYLATRKDTNGLEERAAILTNCHDGFEIAKEDMKARGPGHVFSLRQHGFPDFKLADLYKHFNILVQVQADVETLFKRCKNPFEVFPCLDACVRNHLTELTKHGSVAAKEARS